MVSDLGGAKVLCMGHKIFLAYIDRSWNLSENFWWATKSFCFTFPFSLLLEAHNFIKKESAAQTFPREFGGIFQYT